MVSEEEIIKQRWFRRHAGNGEKIEFAMHDNDSYEALKDTIIKAGKNPEHMVIDERKVVDGKPEWVRVVFK